MRILLATDTYYPNVNGVSYYTQRIGAGLKDAGHEVLIIAPSTRFRTERIQVKGIDVFGVRSLPLMLYRDIRGVPPIRIRNEIERIIEEFQPDIVHLQGHFPLAKTVGNISREKKIPVLGTNHATPENITPHLRLPNVLKKKVDEWMWKQLCRSFEEFDGVATPTATTAELMMKMGFRNGITPISCGIDLGNFNRIANTEDLRKKFNLPEVPLLISVGRLDPEKNLHVILEALAKVPASVRVHFAIVGRGCERERLETLVDELKLQGRVSFLGFVPNEELPPLYSLAEAFVIAGTAETQSIVTLEAMACGLPVLAVNAMALPELVNNGENGYLFELEDTDQLARQIADMFSDDTLRRSMGDASLEMVKKHDMSAVMEQLQHIYQDLILHHSDEKTHRQAQGTLA